MPDFPNLALRWVGLDKFTFTSDQLTPGLTDRQRFSAWIELYVDNFRVRGDFKASGLPFQANMDFAWVGDVILGIRLSEHRTTA